MEGGMNGDEEDDLEEGKTVGLGISWLENTWPSLRRGKYPRRKKERRKRRRDCRKSRTKLRTEKIKRHE